MCAGVCAGMCAGVCAGVCVGMTWEWYRRRFGPYCTGDDGGASVLMDLEIVDMDYRPVYP